MFIFICLFSRSVLKFFDALLGDGIYIYEWTAPNFVDWGG